VRGPGPKGKRNRKGVIDILVKEDASKGHWAWLHAKKKKKTGILSIKGKREGRRGCNTENQTGAERESAAGDYAV